MLLTRAEALTQSVGATCVVGQALYCMGFSTGLPNNRHLGFLYYVGFGILIFLCLQDSAILILSKTQS